MKILKDKLEILRLCRLRGGTDAPISDKSMGGIMGKLPDNRTAEYLAGQITRPVMNPCLDPHQKVFDNEGNIGTGLNWICSSCGIMGFDPFQPIQSEYDKLVDKFHGTS